LRLDRFRLVRSIPFSPVSGSVFDFGAACVAPGEARFCIAPGEAQFQNGLFNFPGVFVEAPLADRRLERASFVRPRKRRDRLLPAPYRHFETADAVDLDGGRFARLPAMAPASPRGRAGQEIAVDFERVIDVAVAVGNGDGRLHANRLHPNVYKSPQSREATKERRIRNERQTDELVTADDADAR
jgi:hypothetical protein